MTEPKEAPPSALPARATRDGETLLLWGWVEPTVWTERMLTALDNGVKGGKWFSLIEHQRRPNSSFAERGLYSLKTAHALARQSCFR